MRNAEYFSFGQPFFSSLGKMSLPIKDNIKPSFWVDKFLLFALTLRNTKEKEVLEDVFRRFWMPPAAFDSTTNLCSGELKHGSMGWFQVSVGKSLLYIHGCSGMDYWNVRHTGPEYFFWCSIIMFWQDLRQTFWGRCVKFVYWTRMNNLIVRCCLLESLEWLLYALGPSYPYESIPAVGLDCWSHFLNDCLILVSDLYPWSGFAQPCETYIGSFQRRCFVPTNKGFLLS